MERRRQFLAVFSRLFFDFSHFFDRKFLNKRMTFQITFCNKKFFARSACVKVMRIAWSEKQFRQCVEYCLLMEVSTASELCQWFIVGNCQKLGFLNTCRLLQKHFVQFHQQEKLTRLRVAHWIARRNIREHFRLRLVLDSWSGQGIPWVSNNFSFICFCPLR